MNNFKQPSRRPILQRTLFALFLFAGFLNAYAQNPPPVIDHTPIKIAPRGKPINIIAKIDGKGRTVSSVTLYFRQSPDAAPVSVEMNNTALNSYYGTIPSSYVSGKGIIQYYIEAANDLGEWSETRYNTVSINDPSAPEVVGAQPPIVDPSNSGSAPMEPVEVKEGKSWLWPTVLIGGGALAVAGAIALADSGSSDSGGGNNDNSGGDNSGGDTGGDTSGGDTGGGTSQITSTANDSFSGVGTFPAEQVIDITSQLAGRTVESVEVTLAVDPVDSFEETLQVRFGNTTVIDTGPQFLPQTFNGAATGSDSSVVISVQTSRPDSSGTNNYRWNATVTFTLSGN